MQELKAILDGATLLAPESSKCSKQNPFTVDILSIIHAYIDHNDPHDAAIFTCLTTTFYAIVRLGEFTVPTIKSFNPSKHITHMNISNTVNHNNLPVTRLHILSTKMSPLEEEDVFWSAQEGPPDPKATLENYF
jgi:hypothetical protein